MFKVILVISACLAAATATISSCNRGHVLGPDVVDIRINTCPDPNSVCRIIRGTNILGEIDFIATSQATSLRPEIRAHALGTTVFYELPEDRTIGCNWISGTSCPLSNGEFATYDLYMPITDAYPLIPLDIEVRLFDQDNNIQFCVSIGSEVVLN